MTVHHLNTASLCPLNLIKVAKNIQRIQMLMSKLPFRKESFLKKKILEIVNGPLGYIAKEQVSELLMNQFQWDVEKELQVFNDLKDMKTHCLLIESNDGLILVDTGIGYKFSQNIPLKTYLESSVFGGFAFDPMESAYKQILELGYLPSDVKHIFVSHLDFDHGGGMVDFPEATVHISQYEVNAAFKPQTTYDKKRYLPKLWDHHPNFELYDFIDAQQLGLFPVEKMRGIKEDIYIIPLSGHSIGHCGVLVEGEGLIFAGDAYLHHKQMDINDPYEGIAIKLYNQLTNSDKIAHKSSLNGLRLLKEEGYKVICSHDSHEFCSCPRPRPIEDLL